MPAVLIGWLLNGAGWIKQGAAALCGLVGRYPLPAVIVALCGLSVLLWHSGNVARSERDAAHATVDRMTAASKKAEELAAAQRKADEQHYKELAADAATKHETEMASVRSATDRFIAAHSVRPGTVAGSPGAAAAQTESGGAGFPPIAAADPVVVEAEDVRTCAADYAYAKAAHDWAMSLSD